MNSFPFLPPALTSAIILAFLLGSAKNLSSSKQYRSLFLLCLNTVWWHGSWVFLFLTKSESTAYLIAKFGHVGILALPMTVHYFYATLAGKESRLFLTKVCLYVLFLICLLFTDWVIRGVYLFPWGYYPKAGVLHPIFLLVVTYFLVDGLFLCFKEMKRTKDPAKQRILKICQIGGVVYSLGAVDFLVNYRLIENYPFGFAYSLMFMISAIYSVSTSDIFSKEARLIEADRNLEESRKFNEALSRALKEKEKELVVVQADLIQSEKLALLGTMSASISHELNNSLNFVSGAISPMENLLAELGTSQNVSKIMELFDLMKDGINLSIDIIENLRSYSTKDSDQFDSVNIFKVANTVVSIVKSRIPDSTHVSIDIPKDFTAFGSYAGFNQLIMNLFKNSLDAVTGEGTVVIRVKVHQETWDLQIEDSGEGIPKENLGKVFDPFFSTKVAGKGTGLGLFVVQKEVKRHQGEIKLESEFGKGTRVTITFPLNLKHKMEPAV